MHSLTLARAATGTPVQEIPCPPRAWRGLGGAGFPSGPQMGPPCAPIRARVTLPSTARGRTRHLQGREAYQTRTQGRTLLEGMLHRPPGRSRRPRASLHARRVSRRPRDTSAEIMALEKLKLSCPRAKHRPPPGARGAYICGEESAMIESIEGKARACRATGLPLCGRGRRVFGRPNARSQRRDAPRVARICPEGPEVLAANRRRTAGRACGPLFRLRPRPRGPGVYLLPARLHDYPT